MMKNRRARESRFRANDKTTIIRPSPALRALPNILSSTRGVLAFFFLSDSMALRLTAIFFALCTDYFDGYLARRFHLTSRLGTLIDPVMDKFFVLFAASVFLWEGRVSIWALLALISRDIFLCLFALYLHFKGRWSSYRCHAIWWGKVTTVGQLTLLLGLTLNFTPPSFLFTGFIILGLLTFIELISGVSKERAKKSRS